MDIQKSLIKFKYKDKFKYKFFDLKAVDFKINNKGKNILFVVDRLPKTALSGELFTTEELTTFGKMLKIVDRYTPNIRHLYTVPYVFCKMSNLGSNRQELIDSFTKNLFHTAEKLNIDFIVFSGFNSYKLFDLKYGQYKKIEYKGKKYSALRTLPIYDLINQNASEGNVQCIGYIVHQLVTYLSGLYDKFNIPNPKPIMVDTIKKFDKFYKHLLKSKTPCFDTETKNLYRKANKMLCFQVCTDESHCWFIPYKHKDTPFDTKDLEYIDSKMKKYFEFKANKADYTVYHNSKYDIEIMRDAFKFEYYSGLIYDTIAGAFALEENRKFLTTWGIEAFTLGQLAKEYCANHFEQGDIAKKDRANMEAFTLEQIAEYGTKDVIIPYFISLYQRAQAKYLKYGKFLDVVLHQIGAMLYVFSEMEYNGSFVDKKHVINCMSSNSVFNRLMNKVNQSFKNSPNAQEANAMLLKQKGLSSAGQGLFSKEPIWLFDIGKEQSKELLFFNAMHLKPTNFKKNGLGKTDKEFQETYANVDEVKLLTQYNKIKKLKTSYVDATYKRFETDEDVKLDNRIRSNYTFQGVVTGRASSKSPNLQQIPSRVSDEDTKAMVNAIKRMFVVEPVHDNILIHADFSSHEVRGWGNIAEDKNIALPYINALKLSYKIRMRSFLNKSVKKLLERFEVEGDIHKQNYKFFFGRLPNNKEERNSVKGVVFGCMYGKGPRALAEDIKGTVDQAKHILKLMFNRFVKGKHWMDSTQATGRKYCVIEYPNGRRRHQWGYLHSEEWLQASMNRKGPNSIIQGFCSDLNFAGGFILQQLIWNYFGSKGINLGVKHLNVVHDSIEIECPLVNVPIIYYLIEHAYTTLNHKRYREIFGFKFLADLVMEFDFGYSGADSQTWDFTSSRFIQIIDDTLKDKRTEFGIKYDKSNYKAMLHNLEIIQNLRYKELKARTDWEHATEIFMLDSKVLNRLKVYDVKKEKILKYKNII